MNSLFHGNNRFLLPFGNFYNREKKGPIVINWLGYSTTSLRKVYKDYNLIVEILDPLHIFI